eukprot:Rhum_TRINITY_DN18767_c0_g1::Rhum_TRINITY_DN18767_c0_g1_i1::g.168290::m.168290
MHDIGASSPDVDAHGVTDHIRKLVQGGGLICTNVEHLVVHVWQQRCLRDDWRNIVDVRKAARLGSVSENSHRTFRQQVVDKDTHHVAILVRDVLVRPVHVVRTHDHVRHVVRCMCRLQVHLGRVLRDAVRILGVRQTSLRQRQDWVRAVDRNRRREHEHGGVVLHCVVDQLDAPHQVVPVVVRPDEVRQAFGGVRGDVVHVVKAPVPHPQGSEGGGVLHVQDVELHALRHVLDEPARQIVDAHHMHARPQTRLRHVAPDEARNTGHENCLTGGPRRRQRLITPVVALRPAIRTRAGRSREAGRTVVCRSKARKEDERRKADEACERHRLRLHQRVSLHHDAGCRNEVQIL